MEKMVGREKRDGRGPLIFHIRKGGADFFYGEKAEGGRGLEKEDRRQSIQKKGDG